ncbi:MAG: isoleucine--tRNA ligase [Erysipelotrichaceae bacterium]|nr:isoleucine--tRNA ligase [Erysipelotrichaceae bacterium]
MEIKESLLMPKTNFEMRGNLNKKEPILVDKWNKEKVYEKMNEEGKLGEYALHDGPPYANGAMHCGHMLNRILKDFVVRYKNMSGYRTPFVFGWDTHGLPIENMVTKSGVNRKTTPIFDFRELCKEYALKQVERQKSDIRRLGCLGDYDNPYLTLLPEFEAREIENFATLAEKGLIYKGLKPVYWSPSSESALAEAEIEYHDVKAYTVYVAFSVKDGKNIVPNDASLVIWTTTPWTLPANLAICANPKFVYGVFATNIGKLVFLSDLKDQIVEKLSLTQCDLLEEFKGKELEGVICKHPFYDRDSVVILGDYVTADSGTGLVHIAPGHGEDDYLVCLKYGIKPYCPVDEHGKMTEDCGPRLAGLFYEDANAEVLKILEENHVLLKEEDIVHSYPHDWRTHKPVIFRATPQWFCSIEPIREDLISAIHGVKWEPAWGETRMVNMIKDRNDWCISRQRAWGVPIPIIYCEDGTPIVEKKVFDHFVQLVRENGSNIWYKLSEKELLPEGYTNKHSPNGIFRKETDIMDVWFDSGSSWNGVLVERGIKYPADLYLEGSDQYRGWFNSSLILSLAVNGIAPYKQVVSHGFVMDEHWEKMSKSAGNGIDPLKIINIYGADVCRLWAALIDYQQDVRISEPIVKTISDQYRKIRNTFKFLLGNLSNGSLEDSFKETDKQTELETVDNYILARLEQVKNSFIDNMNNFNFINAVSDVLKFMSDDLSSFYLDITKDILYCDDKNSIRRRQVQTVLNELLFTLMRLLNPILPFTMDEVNSNYPLRSENNVQFYAYPEKTNKYSRELLEELSFLKDFRNDVLKTLEEARTSGVIGSSQEARVTVSLLGDTTKKIIEDIGEEEIALILIVSSVDFVVDLDGGNEGKVCKVKVTKHDGIKCDRCWNYFEPNDITEINGAHLCPRCQKILK